MSLEIGSMLVRLSADTSQYYRDLQKAERDSQSIGQRIGSAFTRVGTALTAGVTLPLVGVATQAVRVAADFEASMNILEVSARSSGTSLEDLRAAAIAVGADTELIGVSAAEAGEALSSFYKAGLDTTDIFGDLNGYLREGESLTGALRAAIDLAAASELNLAQSSDIVAIAMNTFGLGAEDAQRITDSFVQTADAGVASVSSLAEGMIDFGPVAAQYGFTLEQANTQLGIMESRGIAGSRAGATLRTMWTQLFSPTDKARKLLQDLNIELSDAEGNILSDVDIIAQLERAFDGLTEAQQAEYASTLAGVRGQQALLTLIEVGADGYRQFVSDIDAAATAQEVAAARTRGFHAAMETLLGVLETLLIQIGTPLIENFLTPLARWLGEVASTLSESLNPATADFVVKIGLLAAAAGPIALLLGALPKLIGFISGPVGLTVALAGLALLIDNKTGIFTNILTDVQDFSKYIQAVLTDGDTLNDWLTHLPEHLQGPAKTVGEFVLDMQDLAKYVGAVLDDGDKFNDWLTHLPSDVQPVALGLGDVVVRLKDLAAALGEGDFKGAGALLSDWFKDIGKSIDENKDQWRADIGKKLGEVLDAGAVWVKENIAPRVTALWTAIKGWAEDAFAYIKDHYKEWGDTIGAQLLSALGDAVSWITTNIGPKVTALWTAIKSWAETAFFNVRDRVKEWGDTAGAHLLSALGNAVTWITTNIGPKVTALGEILKGWINDAVDLLSLADEDNPIIEWLNTAVDNAAAWLETNAPVLGKDLGTALGKVIGAALRGQGKEPADKNAFDTWANDTRDNMIDALVKAFVGFDKAFSDALVTELSGGEFTSFQEWADNQLPAKINKGIADAYDSIEGAIASAMDGLDLTGIQTTFAEMWLDLFSIDPDEAAFRFLESYVDMLDKAAQLLKASPLGHLGGLAMEKMLVEPLRTALDAMKAEAETESRKVGEGITRGLGEGISATESNAVAMLARLGEVMLGPSAATVKRLIENARQRGEEVPQSMGTGIVAGSPHLIDPMDEVNARLAEIIRLFWAGPGGGQGGGGGRAFNLGALVVEKLGEGVRSVDAGGAGAAAMQTLWNGMRGRADSMLGWVGGVAASVQSILGGIGAAVAQIMGLQGQAQSAANNMPRGGAGGGGGGRGGAGAGLSAQAPVALAYKQAGLAALAGGGLVAGGKALVSSAETLVAQLADIARRMIEVARDLFGSVADEEQRKIIDKQMELFNQLASSTKSLSDAYVTLGQKLPQVDVRRIGDLARMAQEIVRALSESADAMFGGQKSEEVQAAADKIQAYGSLAQQAGGFVKSAADALTILAGELPELPADLADRLSILFTVVQEVAARMEAVQEHDWEGVAAVAAAISPAMRALSDTARALQELALWVPRAGMGEISTNLIRFAIAVVDLLDALTRQRFGDEVPNIEAFGRAASSAMEVLADTAQALQALTEWTPTAGMGVISTNIALFAAAVVDLVVSLSAKFEDEGLQAAARLAEAASPVMSALTDTLTLLQGLKEWEGVPGLGQVSTNVALFMRAVVELVVSLAETFAEEGLQAAQRLGEAASPVMAALRDTLGLMNELKEWEGARGLGVISTNVALFMRGVVALVVSLADAFEAEGLDAARRLSEAAQPVMGALGDTLALMMQLREWKPAAGLGVISTNVALFMRAVVDLVVYLAARFEQEGLDAARRLADAASPVMDALRSTLDLLTQLKDWEGAPGLGVKSTNVIRFAVAVVDLVRALADQFTAEGLAAARALGETIGSVTGALRTALDFLGGLVEYTAVPLANAQQFERDLTYLVQRFLAWAGEMAPLADELKVKIAQGIGAVVAGLQGAAILLGGLRDYSRVPLSAALDFETDLTYLLQRFVDWAKGPLAILADDVVAKVAGTVGAVVGGLGAALDTLGGLHDYASPARQAMEDFIADVTDFFTQFADWALLRFGREVPPVVAQFGQAAGALFGGLANAMTVLAQLKDYTRAPQQAMNDFMQDVAAMIEAFKKWVVDQYDPEVTEAIKKWAEATGPLFESLKNAMELFKALPGYVPPSQAKMKQFIDDVITMIGIFIERMPELDDATYEALTKFGGAINELFTGLGTALEVLKGLVWYISPSRTRMKNFIDDVKFLFGEFATYAESQLDSTEAVAAFGNALNDLATGLGGALTFFERLMSSQLEIWMEKPEGGASRLEKKLQLFNQALHTLIIGWKNWVEETLDPEALALAASFSSTLQDLVGGLKAGLEFLGALDETELPSMEKLREYLALILEIFRTFVQGDNGEPGMDDIPAMIVKAGRDVIGALEGARVDLGGEQGKWKLVGTNMMKDGLVAGIEQGLWGSQTRLQGVGQWAAEQLFSAFKNGLGIASPSAVFREAALEIPAGIAAGLEAGKARVGRALDGLMADTGMDRPSLNMSVSGRRESHLYVHLDGSGLRDMNPQQRQQLTEELARHLRAQGISAARA